MGRLTDDEKAHFIDIFAMESGDHRTDMVEAVARVKDIPNLSISEIAETVVEVAADIAPLERNLATYIRAYDALVRLSFDFENLLEILNGDLEHSRDYYFNSRKASKEECLESWYEDVLSTYSAMFDLIVDSQEDRAFSGDEWRKRAKKTWSELRDWKKNATAP